ncbi:hypothetical protein DICVIV_09960, partial [Dictyocaulus viviparus]
MSKLSTWVITGAEIMIWSTLYDTIARVRGSKSYQPKRFRSRTFVDESSNIEDDRRALLERRPDVFGSQVWSSEVFVMTAMLIIDTGLHIAALPHETTVPS